MSTKKPFAKKKEIQSKVESPEIFRCTKTVDNNYKAGFRTKITRHGERERVSLSELLEVVATKGAFNIFMFEQGDKGDADVTHEYITNALYSNGPTSPFEILKSAQGKKAYSKILGSSEMKTSLEKFLSKLTACAKINKKTLPPCDILKHKGKFYIGEYALIQLEMKKILLKSIQL